MDEEASPSPSSSSPASSELEWNPTDAVLFVGLSLVLGIACRHLLRGTRVPYTVALLVIGIGLGSLVDLSSLDSSPEYGTHHQLGKIGDGIRLWSNIDPDLLLAVFLPALLFESSFSMEVHQIKVAFLWIFLEHIHSCIKRYNMTAVIVNVSCMHALAYFYMDQAFDYFVEFFGNSEPDWRLNWKEDWVTGSTIGLGSLIKAVELRCIVQMILLAGPGVLISTFCLGSVLKFTFPYNWSWKTSLLLGGLLSATDPVAVVALLKELGASKKLSTIVEGESLMNDGVGIGLAFGIASVLWLGFIFNDTIIEITLTLAVSYVAYFTAQEGADVSGVLTVMTLGMFYSAFAKTAFKGDGQQSLHHFWEMVAYIANTLIFILSGVVIAEGILKDSHIFAAEKSWAHLFLLYAYVQVSRCIVVGALYPFLRYFGYGLDWKEAIILIWSGLRGAVALSLSLSVKASNRELMT
ncbi:sodium/hydrogen exchanger 8 isoform X1 [Senna tora]|uniref:Sodium/hydrogen exchanger 8 isoform X1 n=1 Tax=Senna tora TaxID=362788 RepID=A0A834TVS6_9FABA|nr:sodium/hydrogen exchanger 8 isoform X1 [Senna tora]